MVVDHWVSEVDGERIAAVRGTDRPEALTGQRDRLVPPDRLERVGRRPAERLTQTIRIVVERGQRDSFGQT